MIIGSLNGYELHAPDSGGKAGYGCNVTSSLQVRRDSRIVKQFRFKVEDKASQQAAVRKAKEYMLFCPDCKGTGRVQMPPTYPPRPTEYTFTDCECTRRKKRGAK